MSAAEAAKQAARLTDPVEHGLGLLGMLAGMLLGAIVGALLLAAAIASGGTLLIAMAAVGVAGLTAGGGLAGGQLARGLSTIFGISGITTGAIAPLCSSDTIVGNLKAARAVLDKAMCDGLWSMFHPPMPPVPLTPIAEGSSTVYINGMPAARQKDKLVCSADIKQGEPTVIIGGQTVRLLEVHDIEAELERILGYVALGAAAIELILLGGGYLAGAICGTVLLQAVGIGAAMLGINYGLGELGDAMGPGWRDTLQGGFGVATIMYSGYQGVRALNGRPLIGEPVDGVTGEVCVQHKDFELPGALPVVLSRAHISGLERGGWFGRRWASTWGQWVHATGGKAVYYSDDGRQIAFDVPEIGAEARNRHVAKVRMGRTERGYSVRDEARRTLRFERAFGERWLLTSIEDDNANRILFDYDDRGALTEVLHTGGYRLRVESTPAEIRSVSLVGENGALEELVRYGYDEAGRLAEVVDGSGLPFHYRYDDEDRVAQWTDRRGTWFAYVYDAEGRCVAAHGAESMYASRMAYDPDERTNVFTDSLGNTTTFVYNERLQVVERTDARGGVTRTEWDHRSNKLSEEDPNGALTTYEYDADDNLVRAADAEGRVATFTYEGGRPTRILDPAGTVWTRSYDAKGNLVEAGVESGPAVSYERDALGNLMAIATSAGDRRELSYDARGLLAWERDWTGGRSSYERDGRGRVTASVDALGNAMRYAYDRLGNLASATLASGATIRWTYDAESNLVRCEDPDGRATTYRYGVFDLLAETKSATGARARYRYDTEGRLVFVENERGEPYRYEYNETGQVARETDFAGRATDYEYDAAGRLSRRVGASGAETTYESDGLGRLVRKMTADGDETRFEYDVNGRVANATNRDASVVFERDDLGRVVREAQNDRAVESSYDARGFRSSRRTSTGHAARWSFDANGRPERVGLPGGETIAFAHDAAGRQVERRTRDGLVTRREYDALARLTRQWTALEGAAAGEEAAIARAIAETRYRYDESGNPIEVLDGERGGARYAYDAARRLVGVSRDRGAGETFAYDSTGNVVLASRASRGRTSRAALGERRYAAGGRLESAGTCRYEYDADGRVVAKTEGGERPRRWEYEWTGEGRLRGVRTPEGERYRYAYDAFGRRVEKTGPHGRTEYVWDGDLLAEEIRDDGRVAAWEFEPGTFRPIAKCEGERVYACLTDAIGTPTELVTTEGTVAWSARLDAWGAVEEVSVAETDCPIRFQGQYADDESGLHYNRFRYYDPETGRYVSPDPIGLDGGPNPYAYGTNPVAWVDPLGLTACTPEAPLPPRPANSPNYSVEYRAQLPENLYPGRSEFAHFAESNRQLYQTMQSSPEFAAQLEGRYPGITDWVAPGPRGAFPRNTPASLGLTWHHNAYEPGAMELIPISQHRAPGPIQGSLHPNQTGGMEIWGGGR